MKKILSIKNLNTLNGNTQILKNINLEVLEDEVVAVVGESGCGKSTLLRWITNMTFENEIRESGSIVFNEIEILNANDEEMRKIRGEQMGIVLQNPAASLNPIRKLKHHFLETIKSTKKVDDNIALNSSLDVLKKMNLKHEQCILDSYPFELSGGMNQRAALGLALVRKPKILIADEPTSALDVTVQKAVISEMMMLKKEFKTSIIIVTHSIGVAKYMADKIAVMHQGSIVEFGKTNDVLNSAKHNYTKSLINSVPKLKKDKYSYNNINLNNNILELKNVNKVFKKGDHYHKASQNINFQLKYGECLGIVGESGSGKSTLAKLIMNLEQVDSGEILFKNQDISKIKGKKLRKVYKDIQMVFQDSAGSFDPKMTIGESIMEYVCNFCSISKKDRRDRVDQLLEKVGLHKEYYFRYPRELSGGQLQRAAIARALSSHAKILICDEATSALDVSVQAQIIELLKNVQKEMNISYIFICHDLVLVSSFCDKVIVMKDGKIEESGRTDKIINNPESAYTKKLLSSVLLV